MNILIELGAHYLNNFGDVSMFIVGLERIQAVVPSATLYIHTSVPEKIKELFPQVQPIPLNGSALWYQTWFPNVAGWKRFARIGYLLKRLESWAKLRYPRSVFNLYRTWLRLRNRLGTHTEHLKQMEVVILDGQTIDQRLTWAIQYLWENAEALRPAILSATEAQIEAGQRAYQTVFAPYQKN